jgi:hypothetical protein
MIIGFHGNLGDPDSSLKKTGPGATGTANSGMIRRPCVCGRTGTKRRRSKVSPSEGNEARREGCQEVAASHSSGEAGERPIRTPWSEGDAALWTGSWNHAEDTVPHRRVTAKRPSRVRDSDTPQRDEPDALMCTSGSVGAVKRSCGCICYDWTYNQDITRCTTTGTLPRRAAGVIRRCEALGTT